MIKQRNVKFFQNLCFLLYNVAKKDYGVIMRNKKIGILVLVALLSVSNCVMADNNSSIDFSQDNAVERIRANKDTVAKAQEAMAAKDYQTAINLLTAYINEKPKKYEVYKLRGDAYYALRRYYMAQKDYQTAVDIKSSEDKLITNTKYVSAIVLGADKHEQLQNAELGDLYGALMYAQKAMNDPGYTTSYENAVKYNSHIYLPQPNKNDINKINCPQKYGKILNPQGIDIKIYGAIDDIAKGNFNESLYKLQDVITQYPNYYLGYYLTGVALSELEKDDDAIKSFEKAISLNPYDFESRASLGRIYYSKAETTFSDVYARKSIDYFNQAIKQNSNCPTYYFYIGMNELQIGNTNVAISNFDKALKINPSDYNSMYYKLIAQYINGNYQDVVDGTSKLLLKHVSNYNSVLYLRALAYTKLNDNDRALQDLNTIENNIGDIYNVDIKTISAREKSLESYVHYLKAQIQHSKGAGAAEDNDIAYSNPIIDRLANAQKAMEPYEKSLQGETVSLSDYNKFESFYSTSLPKLLESGAVITYDDIDNQYDYIRTTFADLGISFLYKNPNYKMTTIKDYPYKKYSPKLNRGELSSLTTRPASDMANVELARTQNTTLRKTTPPSELVVQSGQQSLAQMLAANALSDKPKPIEIKKPIALRDTTSTVSASPQFKSETPDAEKINTSKNIASGDLYESKTPAVDVYNKKKVNQILSEEKTIEGLTPVSEQGDTSKNIETAQNGSVKISVKEPVKTQDVVIRNKPEVVPDVKQTEQKISETSEKVADTSVQSSKALEPMKFNASEIKQTDDFVIKYPEVKPAETITQTTAPAVESAAKTVSDVTDIAAKTSESAQLSAKEAKKLAKEQAKLQKEAAKLAKKEAKQKLAEEKEAIKLAQQQEKDAIKLAQREAQQKLAQEKEALELMQQQEKEALKLAKEQELQRIKQEKEAARLAKEQLEQELKAQQETVQNVVNEIPQKADSMREGITDNAQTVIAQAPADTREITEKHANIEPDINIQKDTKSLTIDDINDIVELDTSTLNKKLNNESDLFNSNTVFVRPQAETQDLTPPVTIAEEPVIRQTQQTVQQISSVETVAQAPVQIVENTQATVSEVIPAEQTSQIGVPVVNVPEITVPGVKTSEKEITQAKEEQFIVEATQEVVSEVPPQEVKKPDEAFVKEKLSEAINQIIPKQNEDEVPYSAISTSSDVEMTLTEANMIKAKRLKLKEDAKYAKEQKKAFERKEKEQKKLKEEQERITLMAQRDAIKEQEKAEKNKEKEKISKARQELKQQKAFEKEQLKLAKQQAKLEHTEVQAPESVSEQSKKSWLNAIISKNDNTEPKVEKTAQQIRAEQSRQAKKLEKEMAKQQKILEQEQEKIVQQNDETKIQRLKAKLAAMRGSLTSEEKKAQKAQLKTERAKAREEYKAKQLAKKSAQNAVTETEKFAQEQIAAEQKAIEKAQKEQQKAEQRAIEQAQKLELKNQKAIEKAQKAEQRAIEKAQREQQQAYEKAQKQQQKAEEYAQKMAQKEQKAYEKTINNYSESKEKFSFKNMFSKMKFWKKNK